jgi:hypothetical protein
MLMIAMNRAERHQKGQFVLLRSIPHSLAAPCITLYATAGRGVRGSGTQYGKTVANEAVAVVALLNLKFSEILKM